MANTKLGPPKAKIKAKAKIAEPKAKSTAEKTKELVNQLKKANSGTYCIRNIQWNKDDMVRLISHRTMQLIIFTSPASNEQDAYFAANWDEDEESITNAKGATWYNQLIVWFRDPMQKPLQMFEPVLAGAGGKAPEHWTHYGLWYSEYDNDMVEEELVIAFRQYFVEMSREPELRAVPISKLAVNIEATVEDKEKYVQVL